ncbi:hypothetical protein [Mycolicibacterium goodii]|uniref:hypothetical protein n=1 Tax=Mycolicibacterium goodii TaxID=134601 RepID=UPI001FF06593|nr:hypothetical protein [Mycolicibacterium goodii]ULN46371.1 hypothetical protein MI170_24215 [Mycolicibacterium goodii]
MTAPEQLSVLDAGFLEAEDFDPNVSLTIGAVAITAGPMPEFETLKAALAERILSVPRLRQVLARLCDDSPEPSVQHAAPPAPRPLWTSPR